MLRLVQGCPPSTAQCEWEERGAEDLGAFLMASTSGMHTVGSLGLPHTNKMRYQSCGERGGWEIPWKRESPGEENISVGRSGARGMGS